MPQIHQYEVVGRAVPTNKVPVPAIYRMKIFANNEVLAKSRYWYFLSKMRKIKKSNAEILNVSEVYEKKPLKVKNFGVWVRYNSRSGTHNMYKEYRDVTLNGAVDQMYLEMASRHRARNRSVQIIRTDEVPAAKCRRVNTKQFHDSAIKFPLPRRLSRAPCRSLRTIFKASRPNTFL
eukprot:gnl/Hemi2/13895_TR4720_c0_g1_i1.p1 gnl/Hemi2/13895_TR4720_c0_g1~~gnl/Hemi2/13895_TR4720_c0_g1_i1.p1  ORF type:complete len:177 (-),score=57.45 gnl/Hemi2/13895_TR4720_c0_g1_i1:107-637(-)